MALRMQSNKRVERKPIKLSPWSLEGASASPHSLAHPLTCTNLRPDRGPLAPAERPNGRPAGQPVCGQFFAPTRHFSCLALRAANQTLALEPLKAAVERNKNKHNCLCLQTNLSLVRSLTCSLTLPALSSPESAQVSCHSLANALVCVGFQTRERKVANNYDCRLLFRQQSLLLAHRGSGWAKGRTSGRESKQESRVGNHNGLASRPAVCCADNLTSF